MNTEQQTVTPDERYVIRRYTVFKPGFWRGKWYSAKHIGQLVRNFHRFIRTDNPRRYVPFVGINHDPGLAFGRVEDCGQDRIGRMWVNLRVPEALAKTHNSGMLPNPSVEIWDTENDPKARLLSGLVHPGETPPGMVLRAVTLLGNQAPACKGLPDPPMAVLAFADPRLVGVTCFSEDDYMDPQAMIAAIVAADPTLTPDFLSTLSPEQLSQLASIKGAAGAAPPEGGMAAPGGGMPGGGAPEPDADNMPPGGPTSAMGDYSGGADMFADPAALKAVVDGILTGAQARVNALIEAQKKGAAALQSEVQKAVRHGATEFADACQSEGRFTQVQRKTLIDPMLAALKDTDALAKAKTVILTSFPKPNGSQGARTFSDQSGTRQPGTGAGSQELSPIERAILNTHAMKTASPRVVAALAGQD